MGVQSSEYRVQSSTELGERTSGIASRSLNEEGVGGVGGGASGRRDRSVSF